MTTFGFSVLKQHCLAILCIGSLLICFLSSAIAEEQIKPSPNYAQNQNQTFLIAHGATGGGWDWKNVAKHLSDNNKQHTVYRPTLTGLGEKYHLANPDINLTTHINDIVNLIIFEQLDKVILVGHSYAGVVITGVINRIPQRIQHVIFVDAMLPDDGMSMNDVKPLKPSYKIINGMIHFPWLKFTKPYPRDVIQSLNTYTEAVSYNNPAAKRLNASYIAFIPKGSSVEKRAQKHRWFRQSWQRAGERGWTRRTFEGNHVAYRKQPAEFSKLLLEAVNDKNRDNRELNN